MDSCIVKTLTARIFILEKLKSAELTGLQCQT